MTEQNQDQNQNQTEYFNVEEIKEYAKVAAQKTEEYLKVATEYAMKAKANVEHWWSENDEEVLTILSISLVWLGKRIHDFAELTEDLGEYVKAKIPVQTPQTTQTTQTTQEDTSNVIFK
jgi:hypothetical protein